MQKLLSVISLILIFTSIVYCQAAIDMAITVSNNAGGIKVLNLGLDLTATTGIDPHLGESDLPPFPPFSVFETRFDLTPYTGEYLSSYKDYRNVPAFPFNGVIQHRLIWQLGSGSSSLSIGYDLPSYATMQIQDESGGVLVNSPVLTGSGSFLIVASITAVKINVGYDIISTVDSDDTDGSPKEYKLLNNYPNPFNPYTIIKYSLPVSSSVRMEIFNMLGESIGVIINGIQEPGYYEVNWNAGNLASGIYFYRLEAKGTDASAGSNFISVRKMMLMR